MPCEGERRGGGRGRRRANGEAFASSAVFEVEDGRQCSYLFTAVALTWVMGQRYMETSKIMPAGLVAGLSALMTLLHAYVFLFV
ncbi:hypothetical protein HN51_062410 [Arachis hypogaea]